MRILMAAAAALLCTTAANATVIDDFNRPDALTAVVDQRRPEIALSRLRGSSARRTHRRLTIELGLPVLVGTLLGGVLGFGIMTVVRHTWLRGGAPAELPWTVPAALGAAQRQAHGRDRARGVVCRCHASIVTPPRRRYTCRRAEPGWRSGVRGTTRAADQGGFRGTPDGDGVAPSPRIEP